MDENEGGEKWATTLELEIKIVVIKPKKIIQNGFFFSKLNNKKLCQLVSFTHHDTNLTVVVAQPKLKP